MQIEDAQRDMRRAYLGGGPGAIVSALVWLVAAFVAARQGIAPGFTALFFGGMLIFPISLIICRHFLRAKKEVNGNPLGLIALESTVAMIGGLLAAWLFIGFKPALVFPIAAIAVGTHYAVFKTLYGDPTYWVLAAAVTGVGVFSIFGSAQTPGGLALAVGVIELVFGGLLTARAWNMR